MTLEDIRMDKAVVVLLAILGMLTWITMWVWLFMYGLSSGARATNPLATYIQGQWLSLNQALKRPLRAAGVLQWMVRIVAGAAIYFAFTIDPGSWLDDYRGEIAGTAFTVLVIEEISRQRDRLEFKDSIIRQMASLSNDFALDAARIAANEGWATDGSLRYVELSEANLQGVVLFRADLRDADLLLADLRHSRLVMAKLQGACLYGAKLQEASLFDAKLQGADLTSASLQNANLEKADLTGARLNWALYSHGTKWPEGYDHKAAGAILDFVEEVPRAILRIHTAIGWTKYDILREESTSGGQVLTLEVGQAELLLIKEYPALMEWHYSGSHSSVQEGKFTMFDVLYEASSPHLRYLAPEPIAYSKVLMLGLFRPPQALISA